MNKRCASCTKNVYPVEELKCLDQVWHKTCFRCQECNMTLNMKNYKGYNKKPYCNAHYPTTKFTAVADTPESRRIAANTKIQSNIQYHKAFEDSKGKYTAVADDPETRRLKHNSDLISQVEYHGIRQKRDIEEKHRPEPDAEENDAGIHGHQKRPVGKIADYNPAENIASPYSARTQNMPTVYDTEKGGAGYRGHRSMGFNYAGVQGQGGPKVGKIEDFAPQPYEYGGHPQQQGYQDYNPPPPQQVHQPPPPKQQGWSPVSFQADNKDPGYGAPHQQPQQQWQPNPPQQQFQPSPPQQQSQPSQPQQQQQQWQPPQQKQSGRQPQQQQQFQPPPQQQQPQQQQPQQQQPWQAQGAKQQGKGLSTFGQQQPQQQPLGYGQKQPQKQMGYGQKSAQPQAPGKGMSTFGQQQPQQQPSGYGQKQPQKQMGYGQKSAQPQAPEPVYPPPPKQPSYRAMYDYSAADTDEVSFKEGDVIIDVTPIDAGWMEGRVQRTGQYGMLPANYVERA